MLFRSPGAAVHTYNVMEGLHTARFANAPLRWLFFLSGLMGCAMVATGLLLWAVKKRPQHLKALKRGEKGSLLLRVVDGLNLGAIGGLLVALPAYFWANRLLPFGLGYLLWWLWSKKWLGTRVLCKRFIASP